MSPDAAALPGSWRWQVGVLTSVMTVLMRLGSWHLPRLPCSRGCHPFSPTETQLLPSSTPGGTP